MIIELKDTDTIAAWEDLKKYAMAKYTDDVYFRWLISGRTEKNIYMDEHDRNAYQQLKKEMEQITAALDVLRRFGKPNPQYPTLHPQYPAINPQPSTPNTNQ